MNVIKLSLEKALKLSRKTSIYHQKQHEGRRRRGTHQKGVSAYPHRVGICLTDDLKQRLDALCAKANIERGIVVRDALSLYLKIADLEELAEQDVPTTVPNSSKVSRRARK